jgi:type IV pilus assembly protein PilO
MALLPQERHKQVALMVGILAIGLAWAFFEYWYTPRQQEIETLEVRLVQLQDQNRRAQVLAARGATDLEEGLAIYERHLGRLEELIPREAEVPVLLRTITSEAIRSGVDMGSLRPEPSREGEFYRLDAYEMAVIGEYHDVGRFLTSVASLPRIMTPMDLELAPFTGAGAVAGGMESPVVARFRLETFLSPLGPDPDLLENGEVGGR